MDPVRLCGNFEPVYLISNPRGHYFVGPRHICRETHPTIQRPLEPDFNLTGTRTEGGAVRNSQCALREPNRGVEHRWKEKPLSVRRRTLPDRNHFIARNLESDACPLFGG